MMRIVLVAAAACFLMGCVTPTPAAVVDFGGGRFTHCQIKLGWATEELRAACGAPLHSMAGPDGEKCYLYRTRAQSFWSSRGARYLAACTTMKAYANRTVWKVTSVHGLASIPD